MAGRTTIDEEAVSRSDFVLDEKAAPDALEEVPKLEPLPTFACSIPEGWKDAIYGRDGTGSANADNDWPE